MGDLQLIKRDTKAMKNLRLKTKVARTLRGRSRGVTLIEVLLALFIMGVVAIVFLSGLTVAARAVLIADVRTTAESLARAQMESVKAEEYRVPAEGEVEVFYPKLKRTVDESRIIPDGYTIWSVSLEDPDGPVVYGGDDDPIVAIPWNSETDEETDVDVGLQKITVIIKHEGKVIFTLEGYKLYKGI